MSALHFDSMPDVKIAFTVNFALDSTGYQRFCKAQMGAPTQAADCMTRINGRLQAELMQAMLPFMPEPLNAVLTLNSTHIIGMDGFLTILPVVEDTGRLLTLVQNMFQKLSEVSIKSGYTFKRSDAKSKLYLL